MKRLLLVLALAVVGCTSAPTAPEPVVAEGDLPNWTDATPVPQPETDPPKRGKGRR